MASTNIWIIHPKRMLIGIDASQAQREQKSGTEWYALNLIRQFQKLLGERADIQIRLYCRGGKPKDADISDLTEIFSTKKNQFPGREIKVLPWPFRYFWTQGRLSWEMLIRPPDILFCPAHTIPLIRPKKTFTTLHDIGFEDFPKLYDRVSLLYHRFSARLAIRYARHIFTISEFSKQRIMERYKCLSGRISVIPLGFDQEKYRLLNRKECGEQLKKYQLGYKRYIIFVGRLEPKKNILGIIRAYEQVLSFKGLNSIPDLVIVGRAVDVVEVWKYLSVRPFLKKRVRFLGYVDASDMPALYNGSKMLLFPTLYEGFGLPILEAQACGIPVVTSNRSSNPEVAGEGALTVDPDKIEEIASAVTRILKDPRLVDSLVLLGRENCKRFSWEDTARQTLAKILNS